MEFEVCCFSLFQDDCFLSREEENKSFFFQFSYLLSIQVTNYLKSTKQNLIIGPIPIWATEECNYGNLSFRADHLLYLLGFKYVRIYPFLSGIIMPGTFCSLLQRKYEARILNSSQQSVQGKERFSSCERYRYIL